MTESLTARFGHKIKTHEELRDIIGPRPRDKKVIMCHGVFDVVHPGHVRHLIFAKSKADILVASITADKHIDKGIYRPHVPQDLRAAKRAGISDRRLAKILGCREEAVSERRGDLSLAPVYKRVDTCAAEFESFTPYLYSTYEDECEAGDAESDRVIILGNGPNRIGQGLELDDLAKPRLKTSEKALLEEKTMMQDLL